jgi:hypothetical protein
MPTVKAQYFRTSCRGKLRHKTPKEAKDVMDRMNSENRRLGLVERMEYYHCKFCDGYHVGHALDQERKIKRAVVKKGRGR